MLNSNDSSHIKVQKNMKINLTPDKRKALIEAIQKEMVGYGFNFSSGYLEEWLKENPIECFDTLERGELLQYTAIKYTGMDYPCNGDSVEYERNFWKKLSERE